jgi:hypothetical protein
MHTIPYTGLATLLLPYFCFLVTGAINLCRKGNRDIEPLKETDYEQYRNEITEYLAFKRAKNSTQSRSAGHIRTRARGEAASIEKAAIRGRHTRRERK